MLKKILKKAMPYALAIAISLAPFTSFSKSKKAGKQSKIYEIVKKMKGPLEEKSKLLPEAYGALLLTLANHELGHAKVLMENNVPFEIGVYPIGNKDLGFRFVGGKCLYSQELPPEEEARVSAAGINNAEELGRNLETQLRLGFADSRFLAMVALLSRLNFFEYYAKTSMESLLGMEHSSGNDIVNYLKSSKDNANNISARMIVDLIFNLKNYYELFKAANGEKLKERDYGAYVDCSLDRCGVYFYANASKLEEYLENILRN